MIVAIKGLIMTKQDDKGCVLQWQLSAGQLIRINKIAAKHDCTIDIPDSKDCVVHIIESGERGHGCAVAISNYLNGSDGGQCAGW